MNLTRGDFAEQLERIVGPGGLLSGGEVRDRGAASGGTAGHPPLLVRPRGTEQLSRVMALCWQRRQAVAIQGGMTGMVDAAVAGERELAISLERMNRIEAIDPAGRTLTAQAGVTIQQVQEAAADQGLLFAVDWGARGSATVGGGVSTNAGGNAVLRYGMMREQVLGLEAVLADGRVLSSMNRLLKNNTGYDLKQLFIGSEGTLGIVTRVVLRLRPQPRSRQTAMLAVESLDQVIELLDRLDSELGGTLSAFEVMWRDFYELVVEEGGHQWALPAGHAYYVLVQSTGADPERDGERFEKVLFGAMEAGLVADAVIGASDSQRDALWAIRDDISTLFRALSPKLNYDVSVPLQDMEAYVARVRSDLEARFPGARGAVFGHLGDGNLHLCWCVGGDGMAQSAAVSEIVYDNLQPFGGSISAEHGIGLQKRAYLRRSRSELEIDWMRRLKELFDPHQILNPGRVLGE